MFKYSFNTSCTLMDSSNFSFKKIKMKEFLDDILHHLDNKHMGCKWENIKNKPRFHPIDDNKVEKCCKAILVRANGQKLYQLDVKGESRLIGFIINEIFYIVAYDKNHQIYNMS